ncbi:MAG: hypothetical protein ACRYGG_14815 [Janthinobacterium lividum]
MDYYDDGENVRPPENETIIISHSPKFEISKTISSLANLFYSRNQEIAYETQKVEDIPYMIANSLPRIKSISLKKSVKISTLFTIMNQLITETTSDAGKSFLIDLLNAKSGENVREFIFKYGYSLSPEDLQMVLIVIQAFNGDLHISSEIAPEINFTKSIKASFKTTSTFEQIFKNYAIKYPKELKDERKKTDEYTVLQEFTTLLTSGTNVKTLTCNHKYIDLKEEALFGSHLKMIENKIKNDSIVALLFLELSHGLSYRKRAHYMNLNIAVY